MPSNSRLLVFVDRSGRVYALVAVEEASLGDLVKRLSWVKHFKDLRGERRKGYVSALPRRLRAVRPLLAHLRVFDSLDGLERFLRSIADRIGTLYLDDAVYGALAARGFETGFEVVPESRARGRVRRAMLLADSLANYYLSLIHI